jgi:hypothetical protein
MADNDKFKRFLPDRKSEKLSYDAPVKQQPVEIERIPSANDPMGQIQLEGRAYSSLGGGKMPWWVIISGWIFMGLPALMMIYLTATSFSWGSIPLLAIVSVPLLILWKGTKNKLSKARRR